MQYRTLTSDDSPSQVFEFLKFNPYSLPQECLDADKSHIVVAFDNQQIVGINSTIPVRLGKKRELRCNFCTLHPDRYNQDVAFNLMQIQREWGIRNGFTTIWWAQDPLDVQLARLSFHDLGAISTGFFRVDGHQNPTLQLKVMWNLRNKHVDKLSQKKYPRISWNAPFILNIDDAGHPSLAPIDCNPYSNTNYSVEIPFRTDSFSDRHIQEWNSVLNNVFEYVFTRKYSITDFVFSDDRCWYCLATPVPWFLYVLECRDGTFYTGITPDLARRLDLHNKGRGASYTASRVPVRIIGTWRFPNHSAAIRAEIAFKRFTREKKLKYICSKSDFLGMQFIEP